MRTGEKSRLFRVAGLVVAAQLCGTLAWAFTQGAGPNGVGGTPQGHEWLTMRSALELVGDLPSNGAGDPRNRQLPNGQPFPRAQNTVLPPEIVAAFKGQTVNDPRYGSRYKPVLDAILGQRWVDIGGFNVAKAQAASINCFDFVPQLPDDIQRDHFLRERADVGGEGAVRAMNDGVRRFIDYFVAAAISSDDTLPAWDGGVVSEKIEAYQPYFLFGRAIHLLQDSFSTDHTVRNPDDGYKTLQGIKTYLCTYHSDQHAHVRPFAISGDYPNIGDVIWLGRQNDWSPANVKLNALASVEAMKDAWAGFLRAMALPRNVRQDGARAEAQRIAATWLSFDADAVRRRYDDPEAASKIPTYVTDQAACDRTIGGVDIMKKIATNRAICIWNMKMIDNTWARDVHIHIPFRWDWKDQIRFLTPPDGYDPTREPPTN